MIEVGPLPTGGRTFRELANLVSDVPCELALALFASLSPSLNSEVRHVRLYLSSHDNDI